MADQRVVPIRPDVAAEEYVRIKELVRSRLEAVKRSGPQGHRAWAHGFYDGQLSLLTYLWAEFTKR